jgi:hypothetical protein
MLTPNPFKKLVRNKLQYLRESDKKTEFYL